MITFFMCVFVPYAFSLSHSACVPYPFSHSHSVCVCVCVFHMPSLIIADNCLHSVEETGSGVNPRLERKGIEMTADSDLTIHYNSV